MKTSMTTRTRFAPSPTGYLHIGGARTALFNWLFARHSRGIFILRIEDTDRERSRREYEREIMDDLKWLGMDWDEGPDVGGPNGPYRQSERMDIYTGYSERLLKEGRAYHCYCTRQRLEGLRRSQIERGIPPRYDGRCRDLRDRTGRNGEYTIRFRVPEGVLEFRDLVHGTVRFDTRDIGDFIIVTSTGIPTYNLAVVVDDALMEISHVIRGDDHLSNTPKQILLFNALGLKVPEYAHIPLVVSGDTVPLAKRRGDFTVRAFRERGFLPEALVNSMARLGWSPGEGLLGMEELVSRFRIEDLSRSPSVYDPSMLERFNRMAIRNSSAERLLGLVNIPSKERFSREWLKDVVELVRENGVTLRDIEGFVLPFVEDDIRIAEDGRAILHEPASMEVIEALKEEIKKVSELNEHTFDGIIDNLKKRLGLSGRRLFLPMRVALTGRTEGVELRGVFLLLGRERILERLGKVRESLKGEPSTEGR